MKALQVVHASVTLLLLVVLIGFGVLSMMGIVEVRIPAKRPAGEAPAAQQNARPAEKHLGRKARLLVVRGAKPGMEYPIFEGQNFIGRADQQPVDIDLEIQELPDRIWSSRQHAVIISDGGSLVIEDLNSSNGTYVNRNRVPPGKKQELKANDIIQIGEIQLKVLL
jgi:hypothetical protein